MAEPIKYFCFSCGEWRNEHEAVKPCNWCAEHAVRKDRGEVIRALKRSQSERAQAAELLRQIHCNLCPDSECEGYPETCEYHKANALIQEALAILEGAEEGRNNG